MSLEGGREGGRGGSEGAREGGREGGRDGGMTVIHILIGMFNFVLYKRFIREFEYAAQLCCQQYT